MTLEMEKGATSSSNDVDVVTPPRSTQNEEETVDFDFVQENVRDKVSTPVVSRIVRDVCRSD